jgi:hypothetical protein
VLRYARHKGAHYWAIDERELLYRPQFSELVNETEAPPELRLIHTSSAGGERLVVYEFLP